MNDLISDSDRTDEAIFNFEHSDEDLEIAGGTPVAGPATLLNTSYCFTCSCRRGFVRASNSSVIRA
jgi:hypothetical protein